MEGKKRIFLGLLAGFVLVGAGALGLLFFFLLRGGRWEHWLVWGLAWLFGSFLVLVGVGTGGIVYSLLAQKAFRWEMPVHLALDLLFPLVSSVGHLVGLGRESVARSFIEIHNRLLRLRIGPIPPEKILLLMPHCLQWSECPHRITTDPTNCRRCGRCLVKNLLEICEEYGTTLAMATGGSIARQIIWERRPQAVVAVACERDLTSGLQDTYPLAVWGIVNLRPEGYCRNTGVDLDKVREAIRYFMQGG
ncbi:MAG: DUF116 domain-containing protein [Bacillota bacterium]|nr:DUF116 domain-containing protein [Bacillota bacterium]